MLEIKGLTKKFGKKVVLEQVDFVFEKGVYGLLGQNGAGKTTLIRSLTQLYSTKKGTIFFNGISVDKDKEYLNHIGYLPQKFGLFKELKVKDMMKQMAYLKGIGKEQAESMVLKAVEQVNLTDRLDSKVGSLSGGMIRRLGVAQTLLGDPDILIFDEPTAGLDPEERLRFKNIISEIKGNRTIIISTHIVEDVEAVCDYVAIMKNRKIDVCGSCNQVAQMAKNKVYVIPESEKDKIKGAYHLQKRFEQDGITMIKIISSESQDITPVSPGVEDGYICVLENI